MAPARKKETINLRVNEAQLAIIDKATALQKKDRTSFILDVAYREAMDVILDRRLFLLDKKQFDEFEGVLNSAPRNLPRLKALLIKKAPWDSNESSRKNNKSS